MTRTLIFLLALGTGLAACGGGEEGTTTQPGPVERSTTTVPAPATTPADPEATTDPGELDAPARETVEGAIADLAERLGVAPEEIRVVSFQEVTWNDGSLGCPQPGELYTQALVEGSRVVLEYDDETYDYHAGSDREPFLCENPPNGS